MSDSTDEDEYVYNDIPPPDVNKDFRDAILSVKESLNDTIINGPELETRNAQNVNILNDYIKSINNLYILSLDAEKGINVINTKNLELFPYECRDKVKLALQHIMDCFKKESIVDKIPYENYIWNSFKENQFALNDKF